MPSSLPSNSDALALARRIIRLNAEVEQAIKEGHYEHAAALRDQRVALERQLAALADPLIVRNVKWALKPYLHKEPVLDSLEEVNSTADPILLKSMELSPLPPRWLLRNYPGICRATLAARLRVGALDSPYCHARLPVFGSITLHRAKLPRDWLITAIQETARSELPVVWIIDEPAYLAHHGLLDLILQALRVPATEFVVCLRESDAQISAHFADTPGATVIKT